MAESRRYALNAQLDIEQILLEAQHRWLRPAEICEILQNYKKFRIAPEPPNRPPSGSLFLFDRKVLRYFRKDGHNWRKKRDGKTVKEAHERLKAGSVDVLHCYYAHGEENENFQRRSYWMLEEELSHIVLVHYREVKGNRTNFNRSRNADVIPDSRQTEESISNSEVDSSARFQPYDYQGASQATDTSLNSTHASEHEDAESAYRQQATSGFQPIHELQTPQKTEVGSVPCYPVPISNIYQGQFSAIPGVSSGSLTDGEKNKDPMDNGLTYQLHGELEFPSWGNVVESSNAGYQSVNFQPSHPSTQSSAMSLMPGQENQLLDQVFTGVLGKKQNFGSHSGGLEEWQASGGDSLNISKWSMDQKSDDNQNLGQNSNYPSLRPPFLFDLTTKLDGVNQVELCHSVELDDAYLTEQSRHPMQNDLRLQPLTAVGSSLKLQSDGNPKIDDKTSYPAFRQPLLDGIIGEGLRKLDSFDRWMSKELGDVTESTMQPGSGAYWGTVGSEDGDDTGISSQMPLDNFILGPSLSQDQLFSIIDFSPNWAYSGSEIKVLVMGKFLRSREEVEKYKWACMFGELEVPAEIVADGVLRCHTPSHATGRVPFYITCSNRLACSEVREFEFRSSSIQDVDLADVGSITSDETLLHMRFGKLLSLGSGNSQTSVESNAAEISKLRSKISALLKDDSEWEQMLNLTKQDEFSADKVKDQLLQKLLKEKLHVWLLQKVAEGGKGPNVLDEGGQGVLHFAAALGYDWAIPPTIAAGVSVNFRDANGWTALHWAAYYGRERTVAFLISLGAAPEALTDPTPTYPAGRPPAELAASNGHKGIAGYLSESLLSSLSSHISSLNLEDSKESNDRGKSVETVTERIATPAGYGDLPHGLSMKDSLAAVRNATQAAARIHQVFRVQSFQRKQLEEYGDGEFGMSDERALSLLALKTKKAGQHDQPVHAAAVRIQNKFRSWKGRKDFLLIRQRIIKIQAHVRGHQVRKNYRKIIWSVGILDKVILRWRRKGRGLSRFRPEALGAGTSMVDEDDYDFLKEGRKQTEERLQKALARVKSMVQYPEARDQYRRLLNVVSEMQETKAVYDKVLNNFEVDYDDDLIDLEALLDDDTLMQTAS
ncbi:calmodulin-binding transcription activator 1-like [Sesamum indicum]|uniref:Calmodulin-binding transcription activator 1-like n=1 Tax=Sesamum indicum TaxID=4182 RepID=A0A6I9UGG5_SESIN|nr:calmodulin-binding transcription activator 1-like [Sesamum indicum]XP_011097568.1 calmodulin-binding transcription activator 1-like [Sesamum indicum]